MGRSAYTTLGEYLFDLVRAGKQDSEEFKDLEKLYGRDKLREMYVAEREKRKAAKPAFDIRKEQAGDAKED